MLPNQPVIILVEPQLAENVGMTARAMMNCGLYHLRLVNPREDHLSPKAVAASSGADKILRDAEIYARLKPLLPTCSRYMRPRPAVAI